MQLELEIYDSLCSTSTFKINGIEADSSDFGDQGDNDRGKDYGCGNMQFEAKEATPEILAKYGITISEYNLVAGQLETGLSFGSCGWCV